MTQLDMIPTPARDTRCREMTGRCWTPIEGSSPPRGRCALGYRHVQQGAACYDLRGTTGHLDPCWERDRINRLETQRALFGAGRTG